MCISCVCVCVCVYLVVGVSRDSSSWLFFSLITRWRTCYPAAPLENNGIALSLSLSLEELYREIPTRHISMLLSCFKLLWGNFHCKISAACQKVNTYALIYTHTRGTVAYQGYCATWRNSCFNPTFVLWEICEMCKISLLGQGIDFLV